MMPAHITRLMTFAQHGEPKGYAASDMMRDDLGALILAVAAPSATSTWQNEQRRFEASALFEGRARSPERFPGQPWRYTSEFDQWHWAGWLARAGSAVGAVHEGVTGERATLKALFAHWNEFGPEHGFGELIDRVQAAFSDPPPSPKTGEGSAIGGGEPK